VKASTRVNSSHNLLPIFINIRINPPKLEFATAETTTFKVTNRVSLGKKFVVYQNIYQSFKSFEFITPLVTINDIQNWLGGCINIKT